MPIRRDIEATPLSWLGGLITMLGYICIVFVPVTIVRMYL